VMVGVIGPIGSGLPQFGFPRRLAMKSTFLLLGNELPDSFPTLYVYDSPTRLRDSLTLAWCRG
jgi:hypothetical protein